MFKRFSQSIDVHLFARCFFHFKVKLVPCPRFVLEGGSLSAMTFMQSPDVSFLPVGELPLCLMAFPVQALGVEDVAPLLNFRVP